MVGNYTAILGDCLDLKRRGLVIAVDAVEVLGNLGLTVLNAAVNARLLGFLPDDRRLAPRDADHLRGFFGFQEAHVPMHGHRPLPVDVGLAGAGGHIRNVAGIVPGQIVSWNV